MKIGQNRFQNSYDSWINGEPDKRFRYNFARYIDNVLYWDKDIPGSLSKYRIEARTYDWEKLPSGLSFKIIRHPGAWSDYRTKKTMIQHFKYDIAACELILIKETTEVE